MIPDCVKCYLYYKKTRELKPCEYQEDKENYACLWHKIVETDIKTVKDYKNGLSIPMFENKPCTTFNIEDLL